MLFEIKPVALKAMVMAVVVDVALRSVRSVSADSVDALAFDEKDADIGCAFDVGRLIGDISIVPNDPIEEEVEVPTASSNSRYAAAAKSRWEDFAGIELAEATFKSTFEDNNGGFVAGSTAKTVSS